MNNMHYAHGLWLIHWSGLDKMTCCQQYQLCKLWMTARCNCVNSILQAQSSACSCGKLHAIEFHLYILKPKCSSLSDLLTSPEIHIKMSLLKAFCSAIVNIFQWVEPQEKQHYINKVNHMKNNQQCGYKKVNFRKCEEILLKTQSTHYLCVLTATSLSTDVIAQFHYTHAAASMRWTLLL